MNKLLVTSSMFLLSIPSIGGERGGIATELDDRPNILLICIDDLRNQIAAHGFDYMVTPSLDLLASQGRLFNNHYVQIPVSGPSRECMLTGIMAKKTSEINHDFYANTLYGSSQPQSPESFVHHLRRNGYYTVGAGKVSHHADGYFKGALELPHSWDYFFVDEDNRWDCDNHVKTYASGRVMESGKNNLAYEAAEVSDDDYYDGMTANFAIDELERLAEHSDRPFFMGIGFISPHLPFSAPSRYWELYNRQQLEISSNPDKPEGVADEFIYPSVEFNAFYTHPIDAGIGVRLPDDYAQLLHHAYYASITYTDALVGKVLTKLEELGLDKNTIVVVWGDHGWLLGEKTVWGKQNVFDKTLSSTFIIKTPQMNKPGVATNSLAATIDIYPTLCELTGTNPPEDIEGVSLMPILKDPQQSVRESVVSHWRNIISLKTERYRFSIYKLGGKTEMMLYDHLDDPDELNNLVDKHPELVEEFMERVRVVNNGFFSSI